LFTVDEVLDGDTILIETGDYVRLIGVDAPEKNQDFYNESKTFLTSLILNQKVRLEIDIRNRDNYGRLLRYIYLNETNINLEMVRQGYAKPMHIAPDTSQKDKIDAAWDSCLEKKVNLCQ
jgi:micrococcal nuclease